MSVIVFICFFVIDIFSIDVLYWHFYVYRSFFDVWVMPRSWFILSRQRERRGVHVTYVRYVRRVHDVTFSKQNLTKPAKGESLFKIN